mgnify:CR=1 FL=1
MFSRSGEKSDDGVVYVHVEPGHCFLGGGFYQPSVSYLRPLRRAMAEDPDRFDDLLGTMAARDLPVTSMDDSLTGMPQGFHAYRDDDIAEHLKWKHLVVRKFVNDVDLQRPAFTETVVEFAEVCMPLLAYGWESESGASTE